MCIRDSYTSISDTISDHINNITWFLVGYDMVLRCKRGPAAYMGGFGGARSS